MRPGLFKIYADLPLLPLPPAVDPVLVDTMAALTGATGPGSGAVTLESPIAHRVLPLSSAEADYPLLREVHAPSMLDTEGDVRAWRERSLGPAPNTGRAGVPLQIR